MKPMLEPWHWPFFKRQVGSHTGHGDSLGPNLKWENGHSNISFPRWLLRLGAHLAQGSGNLVCQKSNRKEWEMHGADSIIPEPSAKMLKQECHFAFICRKKGSYGGFSLSQGFHASLVSIWWFLCQSAMGLERPGTAKKKIQLWVWEVT